MGERDAMNGNSISLPTLLFLIFLILKLTHTVDWSWWWVFAPLWIAVGLGLLFGAVIVALACVSDE